MEQPGSSVLWHYPRLSSLDLVSRASRLKAPSKRVNFSCHAVLPVVFGKGDRRAYERAWYFMYYTYICASAYVVYVYIYSILLDK